MRSLGYNKSYAPSDGGYFNLKGAHMETTIENEDRDPESTQSYNYHSTSNPNPGGPTETTDVTPVEIPGVVKSAPMDAEAREDA